MSTAIVITTPGFDAVRLGPYVYPHLAAQAARWFRQPRGPAPRRRPAQPTVALVDYAALLHDRPGVPTEAFALAELVAAMPAGDGTARHFPDLFDRLAAEEGYDAAAQLWRAACAVLDQP
jgi:hypothetical protein